MGGLPVTEWTDQKIVDGIRNGNLPAFTAYEQTYGKRLFYFLLAETQNPQDAEELHQDVLLKTLTTWNKDGGSSFKTWLYKLAKQALVDRYRRRAPDVQISIQELSELGMPTPQELQVGLSDETDDEPVSERQSEMIARLRRVVDDLPPRLRELYNLLARNYPDEEIAVLFGVKRATVRTQKHRLIEHLKKMMLPETEERR